MPKTMIVKRTFAALKHPKGSPLREEANRNPATSEYSRSYKYLFLTARFGAQKARTLAEAQEMQRIHKEHYPNE